MEVDSLDFVHGLFKIFLSIQHLLSCDIAGGGGRGDRGREREREGEVEGEEKIQGGAWKKEGEKGGDRVRVYTYLTLI